MSEPFLSASWYRVATLRPKLREHARVERHRYRGRAWYVVRDNASGRVHRLSPAAHLFVAMMDGVRTVDDLWTDAAARLGDDAPSQDDIVRLLSQLHSADLLQAEAPPDARELFERFSAQRRSRLRRTLLNPMAVRIPLWDPDAFLERSLALVRPLLGWFGGLLWLLVVVPAVVLAGQHWTDLTENLSDRLLAADSLLMIGLIYPVVKLLHELGHGYTTKAFGGEVHELGVMLLVLFPTPYVDASAAAGFRGKYRRVTVGAAGMLVELFLAGLAMFVWLALEPGLVRAVAFNVMVIAGLSTVVFNGNPLLRYDGYYILADLIEIPNLATRAARFWSHLIDRYIFRTEGAVPFPATWGERVWFLIYGPASFAYRLFIMMAIALYIGGAYLAAGVVLAVWTVFSSVIVPAWKALAHVCTSPRLRRNRGRAVGLTFGVLAATSAALLWVPWPLHTTSEGVIWLPETAIVRAGTDGFARRLLAEAGTQVRIGDPLIEADEPTLKAQIETARWRVEELEVQLATERFSDRAQAEITRTELGQAQAELARDSERAERLTAHSRANGMFVVAKAPDLPGRFLREGEPVAYVTPASSRIVRVTVPQDDIELVRHKLRHVWVKLPGRITETYDAALVREVPAARDELPSRALGAGGGGQLAIDPRDQHGTKTLQRVFQFDLELPAEAPSEAFGSRVYVRFEHEWEPLGSQWYRRARQLLLSRFYA
jgi:putative peptide zinc metalloprotease protein